MTEAGARSASAHLADAGETVVARSFTGKRWKQRLADERLGLALSQRLGCPEIVGRLLAMQTSQHCHHSQNGKRGNQRNSRKSHIVSGEVLVRNV